VPTTRARAPEWRRQGVRFVAVGATVAVLYLGITAVLSSLGVPFQVALATGYFLAVATHFLAHRHFTFSTEAGYALEPSHQLRRFVLVALSQYVLTAALVAVLPGVLHVDRRIVWLGAVALVASATFVVLKTRLFHPPAG
jgi:putative flippase GtrA